MPFIIRIVSPQTQGKWKKPYCFLPLQMRERVARDTLSMPRSGVASFDVYIVHNERPLADLFALRSDQRNRPIRQGKTTAIPSYSPNQGLKSRLLYNLVGLNRVLRRTVLALILLVSIHQHGCCGIAYTGV